jgi:hypothetical protein
MSDVSECSIDGLVKAGDGEGELENNNPMASQRDTEEPVAELTIVENDIQEQVIAYDPLSMGLSLQPNTRETRIIREKKPEGVRMVNCALEKTTAATRAPTKAASAKRNKAKSTPEKATLAKKSYDKENHIPRRRA